MAGCRNRAATTVPVRAPALRARHRYSTSSPQMKNSSRGVPMRSTSSRVTSTPLKGMTTSAITPSRAAASTSAIRCTTEARPGSRIGKHSREGSCSASTAGPQKSKSSWSSSTFRQSGSGMPSSSISQTRSAPPSTAARARRGTHRRHRGCRESVIGTTGAGWRPATPPCRRSRRCRRPGSRSRPSVSQQPRHQPLQQREPVEGHHDRDDARGRGSPRSRPTVFRVASAGDAASRCGALPQRRGEQTPNPAKERQGHRRTNTAPA